MAIANITNNILTDSGVATSSLQPTITLTTTGTSGAATLVGATLNIPQYQAAGTYVTSVTASAPLSSSGSTNPNITITQVSSTVDGYLSFSDYNVFSGKISGSGTAGYITRYTGSGSTIGNSGLYDDGTTVSLISRALSGSSASFGSSVTATSFVKTGGTSAQFLKADGSVDSSTYLTTSSAASTYLPLAGGTLTGALNINVSSGTAMNVAGNAIFRGDTGVGTPRQLIIQSGGSTPVYLEAKGYGANYQTDFGIRTYNNVGTAFEVFYADSSGRVGINQVSPSYQLDVNGTGRFSGNLTFGGSGASWLYGYNSTQKFGYTGNGTNYLFSGGTAFRINNQADTSSLLILADSGAATFSGIVQANGAFRQFAGAGYYADFAYNGTTYNLGSSETTDNIDFKIAGGGTFTTGGGFRFFTQAGGSTPVERMRITSGGNVGIGTGNSAAILRPLNIKPATDIPQLYLVQSNNDAGGWMMRAGVDGHYHLISYQGSESEKLTIRYDTGNVLIGTTTATSQKLTVNSATAAGQVRITGAAPTVYFTDTVTDPANYVGLVGLATATNNFFTGTAAGDFVMYNQVNGYKLFVVNYSGGVYLTSGATSWTANSDIRLKNINSHIENAVEKLSTLQTINFSYKDDKFKKQNLGLIAQEVEKIFPELIDKNNDGMLGVRYTELVPVLIKAIQELKLEIETLKNK
jgi:hypothetical protein